MYIYSFIIEQEYNMPVEISEQFKTIVDELVIDAENDDELMAGVKWVDQQSMINQNDFYVEVMRVVQKYIANKNAKEWLHKKK